jgi:hypothetical protein
VEWVIRVRTAAHMCRLKSTIPMMPSGEAPRLAAQVPKRIPKNMRRIQSAAMRSLHLVKRMALAKDGARPRARLGAPYAAQFLGKAYDLPYFRGFTHTLMGIAPV